MKSHRSTELAMTILPLALAVIAGVFYLPAILGAEKAAASSDSSEIVGGSEAEPGAWPWMAALVFSTAENGYDGQFCGGTLVAPEWVLTAAHCTRGLQSHHIHVILGRHELSSDEGERIAVTEIIDHPDFDYSTFDSDLALLRLESPSVQVPIALVTAETASLAEPETLSKVIGWGSTIASEPARSDTLQQVDLPIVVTEICNAPESHNGAVTPNMLCAGYTSGEHDSCTGDSGGPLMVTGVDRATWFQAGIVSWGNGCATPGYFGVYTRVAGFENWVAAVIDSAAHPSAVTHEVVLPIVRR